MPLLHAEIVDSDKLTSAEATVLKHLCEGQSRKGIARLIHRSESAVSKHVEHISDKYRCHSTAEIIAVAVARRMVRLSIKSILVVVMVGTFNGGLEMRRPPRPPQFNSVRVLREHYS